MNAPYGLEIIDNCSDCTLINASFFCGFSSETALQSLSEISHKSVLPAGAILFVEGQSPRGIFILCSGKVNLSATSREGKILILKTAEAGEALGMSAVISGMGYELTAETATPCQVNFVERKHFLELMQAQSEIGMQTAQCLSRDFRIRPSRHSRPCSYPLLRGKAGEAFAVKFTDPGSCSGRDSHRDDDA